MQFTSASLTAFLLCCGHASAAPQFFSQIHDRDDTSIPIGDTTLLEPVVPPEINEQDLSVLSLATDLPLTWSGSATTTKRGLKKRDGAVLTRAKFTFRYPTVALDHSAFVTGIKCSGGSLSGTLTAAAYTFAKAQWTKASNIVYVTSVDG